MNPDATDNPPANRRGKSKRSCPHCAAPVNRISRRTVDRLRSLLAPVHRYRCRAFGCDWEGNLPQRGDHTGAKTAAPGAGAGGTGQRIQPGFWRTPMFLVANAALVLTAALLVLLIASTEPRASRHAAGGGPSADIPNGPTSQVVLQNQLEPTREPVALPPLIAAAGMQ